jgi:hypothetical protein
VLKRDDIYLVAVQEFGRLDIVSYFIFPDLEANNGRIIIGLAMIAHRHDAAFKIGSLDGDRLLKIGRKGGDPAAAGKGIADERQPL